MDRFMEYSLLVCSMSFEIIVFTLLEQSIPKSPQSGGCEIIFCMISAKVRWLFGRVSVRTK